MDKLNKVIFNSNQRSDQKEIMDSMYFGGKEMQKLLNDIAFVNRKLGGNRITIKGLNQLLKKHDLKEITILDVGCGDGDSLRKMIKYLENQGVKVLGIGVDFNENILEEAEQKSKSLENIQFNNIDVLENPKDIPSADIVVFNLFLHHFQDDEIVFLLNEISSKIRIGLIVNDLKRSRIAFFLFKLFSFFFLKTKTASYDGLVSVARGFRKSELKELSQEIKNQKSSISYHWAFRYLWILYKK